MIGLSFFVLGLSSILALGLPPVACAAPSVDRTRSWVIDSLRDGLRHPPDMNRVSSLVYPLVTDYQQTKHPETAEVLTEVHGFLKTLRVASLDCGQLVDARLAATFLGRVGKDLDTAEVEQYLSDCAFGSQRIDLASTLFFYCRFTEKDPDERIPGGLRLLESIQRADGAFRAENGMPEYYLSSHAVYALYYCKGDPGVVRRGQQYLVSQLPYFRQAGFIDGLAESLIMLDEMGVAVPNREQYLSYLRSRIWPEGSICYLDRPGCKPHWHTTGLLLELQRMAGD